MPLLVWESGDLRAFKSIADAESALEPPDVKGGTYKAFDTAGRLLILSVTEESERLLLFKVRKERVKVSLAEESPNHRDELVGILRKFLASTGADAAALGHMTFEQLITEGSRVSATIR